MQSLYAYFSSKTNQIPAAEKAMLKHFDEVVELKLVIISLLIEIVKHADNFYEDGKNVTANEQLFEWLNEQKDRDLDIQVSTNSKSPASRVIRYKPISASAFEDLHYRHHTQQSRKRVETESNGKVGYLHIPAMSL